MSAAASLYARLPVPLQHAAVTAFGVGWAWRRFGPGYRAERDAFIARETWSAEAWRRWQTDQLRGLLKTAVARVPWYRDAYRGLSERQIDRFELGDLPSLPVLEKDEVRRAPEAFLVDGRAPSGAVTCPTSGSTGTPVRTWWTNDDFRRSLALREARSCRPAGVSYRLPRATFSGRIVVPGNATRGPFHRYNAVERQVYFSAFHLSPANARAYLEPLARHRVVWLTGYAHAAEQLARHVLEQGLPPPPSLRAVITTSEKLTESARATIERAFGCRAFQEYGTVEDVFYACEHADRRMRVSPDAGIVELVRADGTVAPPDSDEEGEVVATGFVRRSQLLIRYRVGDVARWDPEPDATGLGMPILKEVVGRIEDAVVGPDGRRTVRFHGVFTELPGVREAQVIQVAVDRLRIKVVPTPEFGEHVERAIRARVAERLSDAMKVEVERVDAIPRTAAGKFQAVVSELR